MLLLPLQVRDVAPKAQRRSIAVASRLLLGRLFFFIIVRIIIVNRAQLAGGPDRAPRRALFTWQKEKSWDPPLPHRQLVGLSVDHVGYHVGLQGRRHSHWIVESLRIRSRQ